MQIEPDDYRGDGARSRAAAWRHRRESELSLNYWTSLACGDPSDRLPAPSSDGGICDRRIDELLTWLDRRQSPVLLAAISAALRGRNDVAALELRRFAANMADDYAEDLADVEATL